MQWPFKSLGARGKLIPGLLRVVIRLAMLSMSVLVVGKLASVLAPRLVYPYELEWMEGSILDHVRRLLSGQPVYARPSPEFSPYIYAPFYYVVVAAVSKVIGVGFFAARLVSLAATITVHALIALFVYRETRSWVGAVVGAALFSATFGLSGAWFDVARVDSLFLALWLAGCFAARFGQSLWSGAIGGVLLALACFTKQTAALLSVPALLLVLLTRPRRAFVAIGAFCAVLAAGLMALDSITHGWFTFFAVKIPLIHQIDWERWRQVLLGQLWNPLAIHIVLASTALALPLASKGWRVGLFYGLLMVASFVAAFTGIMKQGGFDNVIMPFHAVLSLLAAVVIGWMDRAEWGAVACRARALVLAGLLVGFELTDRDLERYVPTARDRAVVASVIEGLRALPSPLCVTSTGYYAAMAGHPEMCAHDMALFDVLTLPDPSITRPLTRQLLRAMREQRWAAVVIARSHGMLPGELRSALHANYMFQRRLASGREGLPPTGGIIPEEVWVPRPRTRGPLVP